MSLSHLTLPWLHSALGISLRLCSTAHKGQPVQPHLALSPRHSVTPPAPSALGRALLPPASGLPAPQAPLPAPSSAPCQLTRFPLASPRLPPGHQKHPASLLRDTVMGLPARGCEPKRQHRDDEVLWANVTQGGHHPRGRRNTGSR